MARKIVYGYNISLDGFIEDRHGSIGWTEPTPELHRWFNESERETDLHLYGRGLWEMMKVWSDLLGDTSQPPEMQEYAELWNRASHVVFSRSMTEAPPGVRLLREVDPEEIGRMKSEPGGDISLGGASLAEEFFRHGLVDEVMVAIHPVILGGGKRMFGEMPGSQSLSLIESRTMPDGAVVMRYTVGG